MDIKYLDEERKKLWAKTGELEKKINEKSSDLELEIRNSAEKARLHASQLDSDVAIISKSSGEVNAATIKIQELLAESTNNSTNISTIHNDLEQQKTQASQIISELQSFKINAQQMYEELKTIYDNNPEIQTQLIEFQAHSNNSTELLSKINATYQSLVSRKNEIDELYYLIIGYTEKDEEAGIDTKVPGLKDKLTEAFTQLKSDFASHKTLVETENTNFTKRISDFEETKSNEFTTTLKSRGIEYNNIKNKINDLLPEALTTGLSYAFSDKKKQEIEESKQHARTFLYSIVGMTAISLIPLGVSVHGLVNDVSLNETILRLPRLVLAILPLYIPALWFAYSSNRKGNLSKRLIEEYSHKEALSKTYEGLSTQIASLAENGSAQELKEKLLFNILEVSAENPGKLISDYNKSDHPLMDALDKSVKLTNSIETLARLPGFSKMANILSNKNESILDRQRAKAEQGLTTVDKDSSDEK